MQNALGYLLMMSMLGVTDVPGQLLLDQGGVQYAPSDIDGATVVMLLISLVNMIILTSLIVVYTITTKNLIEDEDEQDINDNFPPRFEKV